MRKIISSAIGVLLLSSCTTKNIENSQLTNGRWRGVFTLSGNESPFVFDVNNAGTDSTHITLINGNERVPLRGITYRGDSIVIPIEAYDAVLTGVIKKGCMEGVFKKNYLIGDKGVKFTATKSDAPRFAVVTSTKFSPEGKWDIQFANDSSKDVGIFALNEGIVTGSILSDTGDFRYLEGAMNVDGFNLSAFAGTNPNLFNIKFVDKDHLEGEYITAKSITKFAATRNNNAALVDPYSLTHLVKGKNTLSFKLKDMNGNEVSLSDKKFKDKVVVVSILGSWCPNCMDEMGFLAPWYDTNRSRGVEVVGLAFERKDDPEYVKNVLSKMITRHNVHYDILFAGKVDKDSEHKVLPELESIKGFPTTIFIDKKGVVRKIHTGFNGPATGLFYEDFKKDFNQVVNELLAE